MGHNSLRLRFVLAAAMAAGPASAQTGNGPGPWNTATATPAPQPAGFVLADGLSFLPQAFTGLGYDTNPNLKDSGGPTSAYAVTGASFDLVSVRPDMIASLSASGSSFSYLAGGIEEPQRYSGYANAAVSYAAAPGVPVNAGAFINYDSQDLDKLQNAGATFGVGYRNELIASNLAARFINVQYLNGSGGFFGPLGLSPAFDYNRGELTWTSLLNTGSRLIPYAEVSAARLDYYDQSAPGFIDRSADDYHAKTGLRLSLTPAVTADAGWRGNMRDTDDHRVKSFESDGFDGSFTWQPGPFWNVTAAAQRVIGEPTTVWGVLSDVRSYSLKVSYIPVVGVTVSAEGGWQNVKDIGSGVHYDTGFVNAQVAWSYNSHVQFYTTAHYESYELEPLGSGGYGALRVMTGIRIIPDGQNLRNGEDLESLYGRLLEGRAPGQGDLTLSAGYSFLKLPNINLVTITGGTWGDRALGQFSGNDGSMNGGRLDLRLGRFAEVKLPDGYLASLSFSGFYAGFTGVTGSHCMYTATTDCQIVSLLDYSSTQADNTGPFGDLHITTSRNTDYFGFAVDAKLSGPAVNEILTPFRIGLAARSLDEGSKLVSVDPLVSIPATYKEALNTQYYGVFLGGDVKHDLGDGWMLGLDATAGIYYATSQYQGRYFGYTPIMGTGYMQEFAQVDGNLDRQSFIGSMRLDISRQLSWGTVGLFGAGEYISYVPRVAYNNNDQASFWSWPIAGNQVGTRVKADDAFSVTSGVTVSLRVN